jgi:hypothetical protein
MSQPEKLSILWTIFDELRAHQAKPVTMIFRRSLNAEPEIVFVYRLNRSIRKIVWSENSSHLEYKRRKFLRYQLVAEWLSVSPDDLKVILPRLIE